jgi:hypothetical protein
MPPGGLTRDNPLVRASHYDMKTYLLCTVLFASSVIFAQQDRTSELNMRGDHEMGFSHEKTTHHFELN